jgi:hypothetical protein
MAIPGLMAVATMVGVIAVAGVVIEVAGGGLQYIVLPSVETHILVMVIMVPGLLPEVIMPLVEEAVEALQQIGLQPITEQTIFITIVRML